MAVVIIKKKVELPNAYLHTGHFSKGSHVEILPPGIGEWYEAWQPGDKGKVLKTYHAGGVHDVKPDDDLYKLLMDKPRGKYAEVYIRHKQLQLVATT